ncbi:MAG: hypothetical protein ACKN9U_11120 [Pirellulaceae bacterium]
MTTLMADAAWIRNHRVRNLRSHGRSIDKSLGLCTPLQHIALPTTFNKTAATSQFSPPPSSLPLPANGVRGQVRSFLAWFWRVRDRDDGVMPMFDELKFDEVTSPSLLGDRLINPTGFL